MSFYILLMLVALSMIAGFVLCIAFVVYKFDKVIEIHDEYFNPEG